ncbi:MAG: tRNA (guanosine(46)-N7)-methyltransferase TrmB [Candidatus Coproplasma sp.]
MHKKGHLEERLEACSQILTVADLSEKNMKAAAEVKDELPLEKIFGNGNPVHLEIGCGKGRFVTEMAKLYPNVNFVAVEKISNVLIEACESAVEQNLKNVYFLNCAAEVLKKYFADGSVQRIYLNFSNPLPKLGYVKQRLTHPRFLRIYKGLLQEGGEIWQKTDDEDFYRFSLESYESEGFEIVEKCEDLAAHPFEGNVITEHERRFMNDGKKIFRVVAKVR